MADQTTQQVIDRTQQALKSAIDTLQGAQSDVQHAADAAGATAHALSGGIIDPFVFRLAIFALALWASEENRPLILAGFAAVFLLCGGGGIGYIVAQSKKRHPFFKETIAVLKGDEKALHQALQGAGDD